MSFLCTYAEIPRLHVGSFQNKIPSLLRASYDSLRLTLSWRRPLSYRNQSIDLQSTSMDWFLYDNGLRHERVKQMVQYLNIWRLLRKFPGSIIFFSYVDSCLIFIVFMRQTLTDDFWGFFGWFQKLEVDLQGSWLTHLKILAPHVSILLLTSQKPTLGKTWLCVSKEIYCRPEFNRSDWLETYDMIKNSHF